ncbi:MAG: hypothetical protein ABIS37_04910 [Bacteroidia bacterium]
MLKVFAGNVLFNAGILIAFAGKITNIVSGLIFIVASMTVYIFSMKLKKN